MAQLTIRLSDRDRATLDAAADARGQGASTLVRELAEAEARRLRKSRAREQIRQLAEWAETDPELQAEIDDLGNGPLDWPEWGGPLPEAWRQALED